MSVSGIMCNGKIHELLIPQTIARKTDFDSIFNELNQKIDIQQSLIVQLEQKNEVQQTKIDELHKIIQQHSAMFELLRQRIEELEKKQKK